MPTIDNVFGLPATISVALGILLLLIAVIRMRRGSLISGAFQGLLGIGLLAIAGVCFMLGINLYTYHRLTI